MRLSFRNLAVIAAFAVTTSAVLAADPVPSHAYLLNGSFADEMGGPALVPIGTTPGTLGPTGYSFGYNQGLSLSGALDAGVYSIDTSFSFDNTGGYRRIVDFLGGSSDTGLYNLDTALNFYNLSTGPAAAFADGGQVRVTITRDASGLFTGYVNGVEQLSFSDTANLAVFSTGDQLARFFIDDNALGGEASAGSVDYIAIYSSALSSTQVAALAAPVPEPQTYALMLAGIAALATIVRRRQRQG